MAVKIELESKLSREQRVGRITEAVMMTVIICLFGRYLWGHLPEAWAILTNQWTLGIFAVFCLAEMVMLFVKR